MYLNHRIVFVFFFTFMTWRNADAQFASEGKDQSRTDIGLTGQFYPAGIITTVNIERFFSSKSSMLIRLGSNFTDRKDFSEYNDNEKGNGLGASLGYRKHFQLSKGEIVAGLHTDIWNMWINWKNDLEKINETRGQSYTLVIQPWLEAGYFINPGCSSFHAGLSLGFGREMNVITDGKDVGQGWMISALIHLHYSLRKK